MSEAKTFVGLTVLPMAVFGATIAACLSFRLRRIFFFLLVLLMVATQHLDVNFVSREWYRGTTRGFEFSTLDILSLAVLFSSLIRPLPGQFRWYWPASFGFSLTFLAYCIFSVSISDPQLFGIFELSRMFRALAMFLAGALFVRTERELRLLILAVACAVCWQGLLAL